MIESKKIHELVNSQFQNPFHHSSPTINPPFILLDEYTGTIGDVVHSNLMVNFLLFSIKLNFTPNVIWRDKGTFIEVVMQSDLPEVQMVVSEAEKKKFIINYIPAVVIKFNTFHINSFIPPPPTITLIKDSAKNRLVDLANFEIIDIYDKVDFKTFSVEEMDAFRVMLRKHELQFKHLFFDPASYPKYIEKEGKGDIEFPKKEVFNWNIIKEEKEKKDGTIPNRPSIV